MAGDAAVVDPTYSATLAITVVFSGWPWVTRFPLDAVRDSQ